MFHGLSESSAWKQLAERVAGGLLIPRRMRNPMEFFRDQMGSRTPAILSTGTESRANVNLPMRGKGLHSRFDPKLVGFGITDLFEPSSSTAVDVSADAIVQISCATRHLETLK
jgi:hypothetical protein